MIFGDRGGILRVLFKLVCHLHIPEMSTAAFTASDVLKKVQGVHS